jgi:hypothetical protein
MQKSEFIFGIAQKIVPNFIQEKNDPNCTNGQPFCVFARHIGLILDTVYDSKF